MTGEFRTFIEQVRKKSLELHQQLVIERERSGSLTAEVTRLQEQLAQQVDLVAELQVRTSALQQELDEQREQARLASVEVSKDIAIDGLVKEIDFCIQQLKIANG